MANYNSAYTGAQIDAAVGAVASKANDSDVVHNTGNETVAGVKTFSSFPVTPSSVPTANYQVANKKYIDDKVKTDVPVNAKFTDTTYSEITTAEIDAGTASTLRTITGRRIKYILDKVQAWLDNKVDKVSGKGLSTEDYTTTEKNKLANIEDGANNYTHPATHPASMIEKSSTRRFVSDTEKAAWSAKQDALGYTPVPNTRKVNNKALSSDITLDKSDIGLGNVDNAKQMPIAGGTFTGAAIAQTNTNYTTRQLRNVVMSTGDPSGGSNGDIWIKYT